MAERAQPGRSDLAVQVVLSVHVLQSQLQNNLYVGPGGPTDNKREK